VCTDVGIEPTLQPLDNKPLLYATANREEGARLDVVVWGLNRHAFFDIRMFNPFASYYHDLGAMLPMGLDGMPLPPPPALAVKWWTAG